MPSLPSSLPPFLPRELSRVVTDLGGRVPGIPDRYSGGNDVGGLAHPVEHPAEGGVLLSLCKKVTQHDIFRHTQQ